MDLKRISAPDMSTFDPIRAIQRGRERATQNKTRLSYWFPLIQSAGLPVPKTEIVLSTVDEEAALWRGLDGEDGDVSTLAARIREAALRLGGAPVFLRTDLTSAKHDWQKSCFVGDLARVERHIYAIAEFSACADFMGLSFDTWVVRELLSTEPVFTAFWGHMPITREFRFFVKDGAIDHVQPYWPPDSIDGHTEDAWWRTKLDRISGLSSDERAQLGALTVRAGEAVGGFWSVDWLWTTDRGWVLTDMAEGERSFRWEPPQADDAVAGTVA